MMVEVTRQNCVKKKDHTHKQKKKKLSGYRSELSFEKRSLKNLTWGIYCCKQFLQKIRKSLLCMRVFLNCFSDVCLKSDVYLKSEKKPLRTVAIKGAEEVNN